MSSVFASLDMKLAEVEVASSEQSKVSLIQSLTWIVLNEIGLVYENQPIFLHLKNFWDVRWIK